MKIVKEDEIPEEEYTEFQQVLLNTMDDILNRLKNLENHFNIGNDKRSINYSERIYGPGGLKE